MQHIGEHIGSICIDVCILYENRYQYTAQCTKHRKRNGTNNIRIESNMTHARFRGLVMLYKYDPARKYLLFFRRNVLPALGDIFDALLAWTMAVMNTGKGAGTLGLASPQEAASDDVETYTRQPNRC